ncbi:MAG: ABC transporter permease subunit, partial [Bacillota bacterium]|nr:ABC transporter permease subunit [Bacillota bacterium]
MAKILRPAIIALIWLGIWEGLYLAVGLDVLLPSPLATFQELIRLCGTGAFWQSVLFSMLRIIAGFILGLATGIVLAAFTSSFGIVRDFISPLMSIIKSTPVASFIVLALVWMNKETVPIFTAFLIVLPLVWTNISQGITNTDKGLLEMADAYNMSFKAKLKHIFIPSVWPYFTAAATTSLGMAWKAGIAAEVIATPLLSIGKGIYNSKIYLNTTELFAWTVAIIILSMAVEKLMSHLLNKKAV